MAFGDSTFANAGSAVNDLLSSSANAEGIRIKSQATRLQAEGNRVEAGNYDLASTLALQNEEFTRQSTAVKGVMADRQIYGAIGAQEAGFAGSGFSASGSALDIMRDSAQQGAMQKQLIEGQGEITEAGYHQQATSFTNLAGYARYAAGQQDAIAARTDKLADTTERNGMIMAGVHGATAVASLFTGGAGFSMPNLLPGMPGGSLTG